MGVDIESVVNGIYHDMRLMRKINGLTQGELARRSGVSQACIAKVENGRLNPRLSTMVKILLVLVSEREVFSFNGCLKDEEILELGEKDFVGFVAEKVISQVQQDI